MADVAAHRAVAPVGSEAAHEAAMRGRGEVDTSSPFESVRQAVNRFGGGGGGSSQWRHPQAPPPVQLRPETVILVKLEHWSMMPTKALDISGIREASKDNLKYNMGSSAALLAGLCKCNEVELMKVEEQTVKLEMELFVKEKETFKVLKELQATKEVIDGLKVQIEKITLEGINAAKGHTDIEPKSISHSEPLIRSTKGTQSPLTTLIKLNQAKAFLNTDTVNMLRSQIEKEKGSLKKTREKLQSNVAKASSLEADLDKTAARLRAIKGPHPILESSEIWLQMKQLNSEKEKHRKMTEDSKHEICELTAAIEHTRSKTKTLQFRIIMAEKLKEASRRGEAVALAEMKKLSNGHDLDSATSDVTLSVEEHSMFVRKAQEADENSRKRIDAAMQELDQANQCKLELLERVEEAMSAVETSRKALEEAQKREESANKAKLEAEDTLRKLRSDQIIQNWRPINNNSVKFKNSALTPRRAGTGIYDVNGLSLVTTGPKNAKAVSIGQILSMKLDRELETVKTTNTRKKVSLGQILSQKYEVFSPLRIDHAGASRKQCQPRRKRMGFVVYALLLAKQKHRKRQAASCTHGSFSAKVV
ncbi:hypothetical protein EJB05_36012 [Eragrostis curvula]|uniref:WEB family protein n=1 Tax=Eragrostis curvula TaxID=38414 RepID=A0A5J9U924_9POAL|nr:hypothetical protein EJB05_36012 [Eragrostis curvula]